MKLHNSQTNYLNSIRVPKSQVEIISENETRTLRQRWEETYISPFMTAVEENNVPLHMCEYCGHRTVRSFGWHIFSYEVAPCTVVDDVFFLNFVISDDKVNVIWEKCRSYGLRFNSAYLKNTDHYPDDFYIFPNSMNWTYENTHAAIGPCEDLPPYVDNCGPYYSDKALINDAMRPHQ